MTEDTSQATLLSGPEPEKLTMRIASIAVRNFRLLRNVDIDLANESTVLVGRNNSGKTTLADALESFLQPNTLNLTSADFSTECYDDFHQAWNEHRSGNDEKARQILPRITLQIRITYATDLNEYGPLAAIIVDLDPECTDALIQFEYSLTGGRLNDLFEGLAADGKAGESMDATRVLKAIGDRIPKLYSRNITAIDPNDPSNTREVPLQAARNLIAVHFLKAQRGVDDDKQHPSDPIGRIFQVLFEAATRADEGSAQKSTADELTEAVVKIELELGRKVNEMMTGITPALQSFGYPGLNSPGLEAITNLDIERLLTNYTSIRHQGVAGVTLPESYSDLGSRNLLLMLLTLLGHYREYSSRGNTPGLHLVFIEEPEAHLHPQMQEVFIQQLSTIASQFPKLDSRPHPWRPQFVVSTHSAHVANRASFSAIRYFRVAPAPSQLAGSHTDVLDLSRAPGLDTNFLHQYLTLTRSDLFFADKAILVEGTSERLIVPAAIRKSAHKLTNQYVTLMEVGGAYAHIFFPLLDFLGLPTLIITDVDAIGRSRGKSRPASTIVHKGIGTSNATIKAWFTEKHEQAPLALLKSAETSAIVRGNRYLAYQVPEAGQEACGRTFEDAFILANPKSHDIDLTGDASEDEEVARKSAETQKKSAFALRFAVEESDWSTPRYIQRGLDWLLAYPGDTEASTEELNVPSAEVAIR